MRPRVSARFLLRLILCSAMTLAPALVWAQLSFVVPSESPAARTEAPPDADGAVAEMLHRGRQLESQRRWGEALTLYEDGLRQYPAAATLEQSLDRSRLHSDLSRRYGDAGFRQSVSTMSQAEALEIYSEVLLKIQSHHVDSPRWRSLVEQGLRALDIALSDSGFLEKNLPSISKEAIQEFRNQVTQSLSLDRVGSRQAARQAVEIAAAMAKDKLGLRPAIVVLEFTCGAVSSLDPYSAFLTAEQLNEVYSQIDGNFVGLGIELKASDGGLAIVKVIPGSPAERGELVAGDRIIAVDGRSTADLSTDEAANLLQGREGSLVDLTVLSSAGARRSTRLRREHVEVPSVDEARIIDRELGVAYFRLVSFQKTTSRDLDTALWRLHGQGMKSLIIDLRGNPGGLLTTSVEVADRFLESGVIVSTRGRSPQEDYSYTAHRAGTWRMPLVVLIDHDSASASEIFAGAIRDARRGKIVGSTSYGKGSVQGIFPLQAAHSGLRLTTAKFYSPSGTPYSGRGVVPDIIVQRVARPVSDTGEVLESPGDAALNAAVEEARLLTARR